MLNPFITGNNMSALREELISTNNIHNSKKKTKYQEERIYFFCGNANNALKIVTIKIYMIMKFLKVGNNKGNKYPIHQL